MDEKKQTILSSVEIARANLYVFKESSEKEKWETLLNKAEEKINESIENATYANNLINRVNEVVSNSWKRIKRWTDYQFKILSICIIVIVIEVFGIVIYLHFVNDIIANGFYTSMLFGLLGGTLAVSLSIGKDLKVNESNRLQSLKLVIRPLVGIIFAIIVYNLLLLNIITFSDDLNSSSVLILVSIFAGYSEKFATNKLANFLDN